MDDSTLRAADALEWAQQILEGLPLTREVQDLHRRSNAFRTVLHGIVVERLPTVTAAQRAKLVADVIAFARDVDEARRSGGAREEP